jgi:coenzyme F420 hydrogenase subunit delta
MNTPEVGIVGCGNLLFADDGFGSAVAEGMQKISFPNKIAIVDAGLAGLPQGSQSDYLNSLL